MSATIFRVIRERFYNAGGRDDVESTEVLYCGTDRDEARVVYHTHAPTDRCVPPGSRGDRTRIQQIRECQKARPR